MQILAYTYYIWFVSEWFKGNIIFKQASAHLFAHSNIVSSIVIQHK